MRDSEQLVETMAKKLADCHLLVSDGHYNEAARALLPIAQAALDAEREEWRPIDTAPCDSRLLELLVDYGGEQDEHRITDCRQYAITLGCNNRDNAPEDDEWKIVGWCWTHDHFTQGKGTPIAWRPSRLSEEADDELEAIAAAIRSQGNV